MTFTLSKLLWLLVQPSHVLFIVLLLGLILTLTAWKRLGRFLVTLAMLTLVSIAFLPVSGWLSSLLENRFPQIHQTPPRLDGIIVLGGAVELPIFTRRKQIALNEAAERMTIFVVLAGQNPDVKLVFTGGSGGLNMTDVREADMAKQFFSELGLAPERVLFERRSRNTFENAVYSKELAQPAAGEKWLLITSAQHMPRSVGVFRRVGWPVIPFPVDYRTSARHKLVSWPNLSGSLSGLDQAVHEWLGLIAYRLMGRTNSLFPSPNVAPDG